MKGGPGAYTSICETLREHGYSNIVDALGGDGSMSALLPGNFTQLDMKANVVQSEQVKVSNDQEIVYFFYIADILNDI